MKISPIFQVDNNWKSKSFALGFNVASQDMFMCREYYLCFHLGFLQVFVGLAVWRKEA